MNTLDDAIQLLATGDRVNARHTVVRVLRSDPRNVAAWRLLASLLDEPSKQADCYRRILAIAPDNREAAEKLRQLTQPAPTSPSLPQTLRCPQCGGAMEVRFVGTMQDKRAFCPYCNTEVDLPDSFQHVEHEQHQESHPWGSRTVEREIIQTRSDGPHTAPDLPTPQFTSTHGLEVRAETRTTAGFLGKLLARFRKDPDDAQNKDGAAFSNISPEDIINMAGGPIPLEERRTCPKCQATISRHSSRCEWCGTYLTDPDQGPP